jgi:hypothetical protein
MSFLPKGALRKVFAAVAMATALTGVVAPQPAQAMSPAVHIAVTASVANSNAAAAARRRHDRAAENAVIVNPSAENIQHLKDRGLVDETTSPYIQYAVSDLHIAPGAKADDVTAAQREKFMQTLKDQRLIAEMSAPTAQAAVAKGMSKSLSPYFAQCRANVSSVTVSFAQAQKMESCMSQMHWQKDTKPALIKGTLGSVIALNAIGVAMVLSRRKKKSQNSYGGYGY